MTTSQTTPEAPPARRRSRFVPATFGAAFAVVGTTLALAGGGMLAVGGFDGKAGTDRDDLSTPTSALVSGAAEIDAIDEVSPFVGDPRVTISSTARAGSPDVFVGVGPADDVDRYLAGVAADEVTDFDTGPFPFDSGGFELTKERHEGSAKPKPPASQSFWVAKSSGPTAEVDWKVDEGTYKVVVMNADGSRNVATDSRFEAELPALPGISISALLVGLAGVFAGIVLMAPGIVRRDRPAPPRPVGAGA
jgi:hypothetical protein